MRRAFLLGLAIMLLTASMSTIPAGAAGVWWQSAYVTYITQREASFEDDSEFFLADCNYNGTPELYYILYKSGKTYLRAIEALPGDNFRVQTCRIHLGSDNYFTMYTKRWSGYVWAIDAVSVDCSETVDEDARMYIEIRYKPSGTLYLTERFRHVFYAGSKRSYYVNGRKTSYSSFKKAFNHYELKLDEGVEFPCYDEYGLACASRSDFAEVFSGVCADYRSIIGGMYAVTEVEASKSALTLKLGETYRLRASAVPSYAPDQGAVTWSSNDPLIASVSGDGLVSGAGLGSTMVYAKINGISGPCAVTVVRPPARKVTVRGRRWVGVHEGINLVAAVLPAEAPQAVRWTSSNSRIASVNANGLVVGKKPGTVRIIARTSNGKSASKIIRVHG